MLEHAIVLGVEIEFCKVKKGLNANGTQLTTR